MTTADLTLIRPGDDEYDDARQTFNATIERRPALICRPRTAGEVQAAVRLAGDAGLPICVRGGGHSVAGHSVADDAFMIDLALMRAVTVDAPRRRARAEGGALWEDLDPRAAEHDLAVPGGTFADTGVGGLTLGGGIGWLLGTAGLTCDNLVAAEVVTAGGVVAAAGPGGDPELLWALRGGGGNFGVVTAFEFDLHPLRPIYGGYLCLSPNRDSLEALFEVAALAPPELELMPTLSRLPDTEEPSLNIGLCFQGSREDGERYLSSLRRRHVLADYLGTIGYLDMQAWNGRLPFGMRHYWKGHFTGALGHDAVEALLEIHARRPEGTRSTLLMEAIHGQAHREPVGGTAFGQRGASWNVSALAIWTGAAEDERAIAWARESVDSLAHFSLQVGGYGNYAPPDESSERVRAGFGPAGFDRLRHVKARYDPENRFRFNHNIPVASA